LQANKTYFLLGTLKHQYGDRRGKTPRTPDHVNTYYSQGKLPSVIQMLFEQENPDLRFLEGEKNTSMLYSATLNEKLNRYFSWEKDKGTLNENIFKNNAQRMYFIAGAFGMNGFMNRDTTLCQISFIAGSESELYVKLLKKLGCQKVESLLSPLPNIYSIYFTPTEELKKVLVFNHSKPKQEIKIPEQPKQNRKPNKPVVMFE